MYYPGSASPIPTIIVAVGVACRNRRVWVVRETTSVFVEFLCANSEHTHADTIKSKQASLVGTALEKSSSHCSSYEKCLLSACNPELSDTLTIPIIINFL